MSMQYGHCVVQATATAINSLYFTGIAPSATAALSNAQNAFITSGASSFIFLILVRFALSYICLLWLCRYAVLAASVLIRKSGAETTQVCRPGHPPMKV